MKLFHSTTFKNLSSIIKSGMMTVNNAHKEGHGDMLWFTTSDDYGSECKISIEVPQSEFENGRFEFVNKVHVITEKNISIKDFGFKVVSFNYVYIDNVGAYVTFDDEKDGKLTRLAKNQPRDTVENYIFDAFYEEYGKNEDVQTILDYVAEAQETITKKITEQQTKPSGRTFYITEKQFKNYINFILNRK